MKKTYEMLARKAQNYDPKRFSGRRVEGDSKKQAALRKREARLNKIGLTLMLFPS